MLICMLKWYNNKIREFTGCAMKRIIDIKLLRFITVGIVNTLLGMLIMFGLYNIFGCSYWFSSAVNYIMVSIFSYCMNRKFTFNYKGRTAGSGLRFAVNIAFCYFIAYGAAKPLTEWLMAGSSVRIQENVAMIAGMIVFTGLNYLGQRYFVFGELDKDE